MEFTLKQQESKRINLQQNQIKDLFGLYIHWPYCLSKCPYCDFASSVCQKIDETRLLEGYIRDLNLFALNPNRQLTSIFFGGGTPSLMSVPFLEKLMANISQRFQFSKDIEITIEANPDAINAEKMKDFANLGVNRLSIGVQALNDKDLVFLGRRHSVKTALEKIETAQKYFPRINMDLMYARPHQSVQNWLDELRRALDLGLSHYSLYQLTLEEGTPFYKQGVEAADEELARELYIETDTLMQAVDIPAYEVSNYALKGQESRHNLTYWLGADYMGIGPAAHGRLGLTATWAAPQVQEWIQKGIQSEILTEKERFTEKALMGLRLRNHPFQTDGLSENGIQKAIRLGWITQAKNTITPTLDGTLMLNELIALVTP